MEIALEPKAVVAGWILKELGNKCEKSGENEY
jgi:hypothetical protein